MDDINYDGSSRGRDMPRMGRYTTSNNNEGEKSPQLDNDNNSITQVIGRLRQWIQDSEAKVKALEGRHERTVLRASVMADAAYAWPRMNRSQTRDKDLILMCLKHSTGNPKSLPSCMSWDEFDSNFPACIKHDRDIFLARLQNVPGFDETYWHTVFPVPAPFRKDKEIMMEICKRNSSALSLASRELKNKREVVMAAVAHNKHHFASCALEYASAKLRGDRHIVRAALGREYGIRAFRYLSPLLQQDKKLAIYAIRRSGAEYAAHNEHFSDLPVRFRDDEDVILAAVQHRGSNLRYVSNKCFLKDANIIFQACCHGDGAALEFVPPCPARTNILNTRSHLAMVLTHGGGMLLDEAPIQFQMEWAFILAAVENGYAGRGLGLLFQKKLKMQSFVQLVRASNNVTKLYEKMPGNLQGEHEILMAVLDNDTVNDQLVEKMIVNHANFFWKSTGNGGDSGNRNVNKEALIKIVQRGCAACLKKAATQQLQQAMDDKGFVLQICAIDGLALPLASTRLQVDVDCVRMALQGSDNPFTAFATLKELSSDIWRSPAIIEMALQCFEYEKQSFQTMCGSVPDSILYSREIRLALIRRGWDDWAPAEFFFEEEFILAALQSPRNPFNDRLKMGLSNNCSREFIQRAIAIEPRVLAYTPRHIRYDNDLMMLAMGSNRNALQAYNHKSESCDFSKVLEFAKRCRSRLAEGDAFVLHFLRGIIIPTTSFWQHSHSLPSYDDGPPRKRRRRTREATRGASVATRAVSIRDSSNKDTLLPAAARTKNICHLPLLDCGLETGIALKRHIGEFAGVPLGQEYKLLRKASDTLSLWGY